MENSKEKIKIGIAISILVLIIIVVIAIVFIYHINGEVNMPYNLSKIIVVSTAEGTENEEKTEDKWNLSIEQDNDIYIYIDKNEKNGNNKTIQSVIINNIRITKLPLKGVIKAYMPSSTDGSVFKNDDKYLISDKVEFKGAKASNTQTLEVGSQGGNVSFRLTNVGLGNYISNDEDEVKHDGTLLNKIDVLQEDIKFKVSFDLTIKINNIKYQSNISLDLPCGDVISEGTSTFEKDDTKDIIFKRVNNL